MRFGMMAAVAGATLAAVPGSAVGQRAGAELGRFEVPGLDWAPSSAWRARAAVVRANRWAALERGDLRALNQRGPLLSIAQSGGSAAFAVTGTFHLPVVPIGFSDSTVPYPTTEFNSVLFGAAAPGGGAYTLKTYYEQISNGRIQMFGRVFDPVRTDSTASYYQQNCNGIGVINTCADGGRRFGLMLLAALDSISNRPGSDTAWSRFDNDGPDGLPNSGDDDGDVDFVTFIQPVRDGACGGEGIWAHRWVISAWNGGSKYLTKTPRRDAAGQPIPGQFIRVENYTMQSQRGGPSGCDPNFIMPVGTVAHETGHAFGLPDLYDTDRSSGTEGIGEWGIMGSGNYSRAYSPASYDPWSLNELGWVTIDTLGATRTVVTGPRQFSDTVFLARFATPGELLLIENRQAVESDSTMLNVNGGSTAPNCRSNCRKMPGLLLWHIDLGRIATGRSTNRINTGPVQGVAVEQADGLNNLRSTGSARNRGDAGDPYPGTAANTRWSLGSTPSARSNYGEYAGFIIDQVAQLPNLAMRFRFLKRNPSVVRSTLPGAAIRVNGEFVGKFEDVVPAGDPIALEVDSVQLVQTRTRARWLAWSIGGPRNQTVTSGVKPDTIAATFAAEHRVAVTISGTGVGAVTGVPANPFVPEGTPVTVTATPQAGSIFVGWRGDTTTTAASVTLPMGRPYDLEASFLAPLVISSADATTEVLGTPKLTDEQKVYLDQLGNRNGLYDLGDYLALLKRSGQAVPPAVLQAIASGRLAGRTR